MKIIKFAAVLLTFFNISLVNAQVFDLSEMEHDKTMVIRYFPESPGVTAGIFASNAPHGKVEIKGNFVMTTGAGIYLGSDEAWAPPGRCFFYVDKVNKDDGESYRMELPVHVLNDGIWHKSIVEEHITRVDSTGDKGRYTSARPVIGGIKGLKVKTSSMAKPIELMLKQKGSLNGGYIDIESLGHVEIHTAAILGAVGCDIRLEDATIDALMKLLPKDDHKSINEVVKK